MTSKLQVTLPKAIADRFGIEPGADIEWEAVDDVIRIIPPRARRSQRSLEERLRAYDAATHRQRERDRALAPDAKQSADRGWRREDLYRRGRTG